ncbi:MAG: hypothetical protein AAFR38_02015 [Planctomycetota bacterium]
MTGKAVILIVAAAGTTATADTFLFSGFNHPDGNVNPQAYGLRLDEFGGNDPATFSFENPTGIPMGTSTVNVQIDTASGLTGPATLTISGTVVGNSASGGTAFGTFTLSVVYTGTVTGSVGGGDFLFTSTTADGMTGSLTGLAVTGASPLTNGQSVALDPAARGSDYFFFGLDIPGERISGTAAAGRFEGQGWLNSTVSNNTEDFLFTAIPTFIPPTPGTAGVLAIGGLVAARRRR